MLQSRYARAVFFVVLACWLAFWLVPSRYAALDDCFIHLRYADFLLKTHMVTYDGVHRSFGTSSPLYVVMLALLRPAFPGPMLAKGVSVFFYLTLIGALVWMQMRPGKSMAGRVLLAMLTFCLLCPMGVRWLTDGMETSCQLVFILGLALIVDRESERGGTSPGRGVALGCFGFSMTALRVESASLLFLAVTAIGVARLVRDRKAGKLSTALGASPLAIGSVLAMGTFQLVLGHVLPDTAVAKTAPASLKPLAEASQLIVNSLNLGVGALLVWLVSLLLVVRGMRAASGSKLRWAVVAAGNAIFPAILLLACARGQFMQGIRYVLWCVVFSALWNIFQLDRMPVEAMESGLEGERSWRVRRVLEMPWNHAVLAVMGVAMVAMLPFEWHWVRPALAGRAASFTEMRAAPLEQLHGDTIVAEEVGLIGYFSGGTICDILGLVDGRVFAAKTVTERIRTCATSSPDVLFLNDSQLAGMAPFTDLRDWSVCRTFIFTRVTSQEHRYLMVPSEVASVRCPVLGGSAVPYLPGAGAETASASVASGGLRTARLGVRPAP